MQPEHNSEKSWAGIFDDFVTNPPTASIFRLYLLSFLIWNESAILYLTFHNQSMWDKLKNVYEFVPFHNEWSLYFGPFIPFTIIALIVFLPVPFLIVDKKSRSFYDFLFFKHQTNLRRRLYAEADVLTAKTTQLQKKIEVVQKTEELNETNEQKEWLGEYESFKLRRAIYDDFIKLAKILNQKRPVSFYNSNNQWIAVNINFSIETAIIRVFTQELHLVLIDLESDNSSHHYISLTKKGMYFYNQYINSLEAV